MKYNQDKQNFIEKKVSCKLELAGQTIIVEDVPATVCVETGERFFSSESQEHLRQTLFEQIKKGLLK